MIGTVKKMSCILSFVIINFNNYNVTFDCVDSLLKNDLTNSEIVIVENGSTNDSFDCLLSRYKNEKKVHILKSIKNMGYSGGWNMGIKYSRDVLNSQNVTLLNSDLIFYDKDFVANMESFVIENKAGVVNIELHNQDGTIQRPYGRFSFSVFFEYARVFAYILINFIKNIFHRKRKNNKENKRNNEKKYNINGPAFCLTSFFFDNYSYLFEKNFLYMEEFNLYIYLKKAKLKSVTQNFGYVVHLECQSDLGNKNVSNRKLKKIFLSSFKSLLIIFKSRKRIKSKYSNIKGEYDIYNMGMKK